MQLSQSFLLIDRTCRIFTVDNFSDRLILDEATTKRVLD